MYFARLPRSLRLESRSQHAVWPVTAVKMQGRKRELSVEDLSVDTTAPSGKVKDAGLTSVESRAAGQGMLLSVHSRQMTGIS